jgi:hypothetical protein
MILSPARSLMKLDFVGILQAMTRTHKEYMNTKYTKVTKHTKGM